jgi:hypothetical protein
MIQNWKREEGFAGFEIRQREEAKTRIMTCCQSCQQGSREGNAGI